MTGHIAEERDVRRDGVDAGSKNCMAYLALELDLLFILHLYQHRFAQAIGRARAYAVRCIPLCQSRLSPGFLSASRVCGGCKGTYWRFWMRIKERTILAERLRKVRYTRFRLRKLGE